MAAIINIQNMERNVVELWLKQSIEQNFLTWENVRNVPITSMPQSIDPLVEIIPSARLKLHSAYYHDGIEGALESIYSRQTIVQKLHALLEHLPSELGILVLDAWRPIEVQEALRLRFRESLVEEHPNLNDVEIDEILNQFVAKPSTSSDCPSPHLTGGSIDLTLFNVESGMPLDMGTAFDAMEEESWSHYFEEAPQTHAALEIRDNRRILINGMKSVGFSNIPSEWWHFDYGNQLWGYYTQRDAFYGIAER